ncbi:MAG: DoxX family membrane protein [Puniceicoccaceae bacterium]
MHKVNIVLRILLGLGLIAFGLNKFLGFMPPPELAPGAEALMRAMGESGYLLPAVGIVETLAGVLLVAGAFVPLALLLLAPVSVNIVLFHVFLDPANLAPAVIVAGLNLYLLFTRIESYRPLLRMK